MKTIHEKPWLCFRCGYCMTAATNTDGDSTPKELDVSLCFGCGQLYDRRGGKWVVMPAEDFAELPDFLKRHVTLLQAGIKNLRAHIGLPKEKGQA